MKAVLRDQSGHVEAVCHDLAFLARRIGSRPVERVDIWPGFDADHCQAAIALADGSSTIFDLPVAPERAPWVLNRHARAAGWPAATIHTPNAPITP